MNYSSTFSFLFSCNKKFGIPWIWVCLKSFLSWWEDTSKVALSKWLAILQFFPFCLLLFYLINFSPSLFNNFGFSVIINYWSFSKAHQFIILYKLSNNIKMFMDTSEHTSFLSYRGYTHLTTYLHKHVCIHNCFFLSLFV